MNDDPRRTLGKKMGSAKEDYERFLRWLHEPERRAPEDVRRFANMVLADFERTAATSRQHNQRSNHLAALARGVFAGTTVAAPAAPPQRPAPQWPWQRLRQLSVGPFKGFRRHELFELQKRVLLFYGPNGSGKSSLCEALELALLGTVQEAEARRVEPQQYFANIHARRFVAPRLTATGNDGRETVVVANPDTYRFCFIERNRIDAFARMAAQPAAARTELIATLFGMDRFNDFASHFNESMDAALVCDPEIDRTLTNRRQSLARDQQTVAGEQASLMKLDQDEASFAVGCRPGTSYVDLKAWIGAVDAPGRLADLDEVLNVVPPAVVGVTREATSRLYAAADAAADRLEASTRQLDERSHQVSFKDLYTALLALQTAHEDRCPACDTPLNAVTANPYDKATAGLRDLRDLAVLQEEAAQFREDVDETSRGLRANLNILFVSMNPDEQISPVGRYIAGLDRAPRNVRWWQDVYAPMRRDDVEADSVSLEQILEAAASIELRDRESQRRIEERQTLVAERTQLLMWQRQILERDLARTSVVEGIAAARDRIAKFEEENAGLIERAAEESRQIDRDRPIKQAYDQFLPMLRDFRNELPGLLLQGLNDLARDLYNEFNRADLEVDRLASLHLPLTGQQRVDIAFRGDPHRRFDALSILSEGHTRCLGLAILMAKALSSGCSLIVFDDVVNAIDHDHRSGIRQTIFESDRFRDIQLMVTCHSGEFIKDIHNHLPQHSRTDWIEYVIKPHTGDHHPQVVSNVLGRAYVQRARAARTALDDREALSLGRRGLELLSNKLWKWLISFDRRALRLELDGPGAEPSLRHVCEALRARLSNPAFVHPEKDVIAAALDLILGIPADNLIWSYLNKGTHEQADRDDFDAAYVEIVVRTLEQLNALQLRRAG